MFNLKEIWNKRHDFIIICLHPANANDESFRTQKTAMAPGGEPMPPFICSGALVRKKVHFFKSAHVRLSFSKSQSSPIGVPHWQRSHSCRQHSLGYGHTSKLKVSLATAAKCLSYNHRTVSIVFATPIARLCLQVPSRRAVVLACLKAIISDGINVN